MKGLKNIPLKKFKKYLRNKGWECIKNRGSGDHEIYAHQDHGRPIPLQTAVDPVPERIVKQFMKAMGLTKDEMVRDLELFFNKGKKKGKSKGN